MTKMAERSSLMSVITCSGKEFVMLTNSNYVMTGSTVNTRYAW